MSDRPGRSLWLDPGFGASGDMMLGALLGLGAPLDALRAGLDALAIDGWTVERTETDRAGLSATRAVVMAEEQHHHRTWSSIDRLLADADLPATVTEGARATFRRLGEVEAAIHRVSIDEVHFHEVGAVDAIVDIVGSWFALDALDIDEVAAGPVGLGSGRTRAAHGVLPVPAPATADLLVDLPITPLDAPGESVTPTGAALLATMVDRWGPIPAGVLRASSRGAGGRDPESHPNVLCAHLVETGTTAGAPTRREHALVVTTNVDDATPEVIGRTIARCLAAGADDAWATPILMKKGRPANQVSVLCRPELLAELRELLYVETGTLGVRTTPVAKDLVERSFTEVTVRGHPVAIKVGPHGAKPEYDHLVAASDATGAPIRVLAQEAMAAHRAVDDGGPE